ncbi:MAG: GNAT family N-acetyltransferase [Candidatus Saccharibacteria bacterium]
METKIGNIIYVSPSEDYKDQFYDMKEESYAINEDVSIYGLDDENKYKELIKYPEYIPSSPYWMIDTQRNKIIGALTIRHCLRSSEDKNGHLFLVIRPSERGKGFGRQAIGFGINKCDELGITEPLLETYTENKAAIKALDEAGCILLREYDENNQARKTYTTRITTKN